MSTTLVGHGLYDAAEVGRLLGHDADWVVRWATPSRVGPAVVEATFAPYFSFADLVSLRVGLLVRRRGVADRALRIGVRTLHELTGLAKPLAHEPVIESLATCGHSFLSKWRDGEYEDIGQGGQAVFQEIVRLHLASVTFNIDGDPTRWEPADGVLLDPTIQAGAPCIDGTRIPTATVVAMLADATPEDVAHDFDVSINAILLAEKFEAMLAEGAGALV